MIETKDCLTSEEWQQLNSHGFDVQTEDRLRQHVTECVNCRQQLAIVDGLSPALIRLRQSFPTAAQKDQPGDSRASSEFIDATLADMTPPPVPHIRNPSTSSTAVVKLDFLQPAELPGELGRLGGYRVLSVLGTGGMGMVLKAEDIALKRLVALKVMKPLLAVHDTVGQRFLREAQSAAAINHEHVVRIYQVGEDHGVPFIAMELLEGEGLDALLRRTGRLSLAEVLRIGIQISAGLAAAHRRGLVHRDIKPANIMLEPMDPTEVVGRTPHATPVHGSGSRTARRDEDHATLPNPAPARVAMPVKVKLVDFGLARATDEDSHLTQSGMVTGTPQYMSPEQAEGLELDHRSDLFSLGCVLYRLLAGEVPFQQKGTAALLRAIAERPHTPLCETVPQLPRAVGEVVDRLLAKRPEDRFQSAVDVMEALGRLEQQLHANPLVDGSANHAAAGDPAVQPTTLMAGLPRRPSETPGQSHWRRRMQLAVTSLAVVGLALIGFAWIRPAAEPSHKPESSAQPTVASTKSPMLKPSDSEADGRAAPMTKIVSAADPAGSVERAVAKQVLAMGGHVEVTIEGRATSVTKIEQLPPEDFWLSRISLVSLAREIVERDVELFPQLVWLNLLTLNGNKITPSALRLIARTKISALNMLDCALSDDDLALLAIPESEINWLEIANTPITVGGLLACQRLPKLAVLRTTIPATDEAIKAVVGMKNLNTLSVDASWLQPDVVDRLLDSPLANLHSFGLFSATATADDLRQLKRFPQLRHVTLTGEVPSSALVGLADLDQVTWLFVHTVGLTAEQMRSVALAKSLTHLHFFYYSMPQGSLEELAPMANLKHIKFIGPADPASVTKLHRLRPDIQWEGLTHDPQKVAAIERSAAEWALRVGGTVKLKFADDSVRPITTMKDLPEGDFVVDDISVFGNPRVTDADAKRYLTGLSGLTSLQIHHTGITDVTLEALRDSPTLENLHLEATGVTDAGIKQLGTLPRLGMLMLNRTKVTADCLPVVVAQPELRSLNIGSMSASDSAVKLVFESPRWWALGLNESWIQPDIVVRLAEQLELAGLTIYDDLPAPRLRLLGSLPRLSQLQFISHQQWSPDLSEALSALPQLVTLGMTAVKTSGGWQELAAARPWRNLFFAYTIVPDELFDGLDRVDSLAELQLHYTTQSRSRLQKFRADHPRIHVSSDASLTRDREAAERLLRLGGIHVEVSDQLGTHPVSKLEALPDTEFVLWMVYVHDCPAFDDRTLASLAGLESLHGIHLVKTSVTDAGLAGLDQFSRLAYLHISSAHMTETGLKHIARQKRLSHLGLPQCSIEQLKQLSSLNLKTFGIESHPAETAREFVELIARQFPELTVLGLGATLLDAHSAETLLKLTKLQRLMNQSHILSTEVVTVLSRHPSLDTLELFGTSPADWLSLKPLQRIQSMHIGVNRLTDSHIDRLAELPQLQTLKLDRVQFSPEALAAFTKLRHIPTIQFITCEITDADWTCITEALPNTRLLWNGQPRTP